MTALFELRETIKRFYNKYDIYIVPVMKFILALMAFMLINSRIGYMEKINNNVFCGVLALICCVLPLNGIMVVASFVILLHLFALAPEVCAVGAILFLMMYLLYFRFSPKCGCYTIFAPICFSFKVPYVLPEAVGLLEKPYSAISIMCGTIVYYFLEGVKQNETVLGTVSEDNSGTAKITAIINQLIANKEMYLMCGIFLLSTAIVYLIRRLSVDHAWSLAISTGIVVQFIGVMAGYLILGVNGKILYLVIGSVLSALISIVIKFFCFNLDYTRTERVQFEDDEYYYYVKAVPKIYMPQSDKKIKKINNNMNEKERINKKNLADEMDIDEELLK